MYRNLELTLWIGLMLGASYTDLRHRMVPDWSESLYCSLFPVGAPEAASPAGILCAILFFLQQYAGEESVEGISSLWQHAVCT